MSMTWPTRPWILSLGLAAALLACLVILGGCTRTTAAISAVRPTDESAATATTTVDGVTVVAKLTTKPPALSDEPLTRKTAHGRRFAYLVMTASNETSHLVPWADVESHSPTITADGEPFEPVNGAGGYLSAAGAPLSTEVTRPAEMLRTLASLAPGSQSVWTAIYDLPSQSTTYSITWDIGLTSPAALRLVY